MNNKVLVGGLIGGIVAFLMGYLVWAMALGPILEENMLTGLNRPMEEFEWVFLILGNLFYGMLYAWVLNKANANSLSSGAITGAILALLIGLSFSLSMYGVSNIYTNMTGMMVDIVGAVI